MIGPANGTLIILGGGDLSESLIRSFIKIGGGLDAPIVIIPTADGQDKYDENFGEAGLLRKLGAGFLKNVAIDQHVLTRNRHFDMIEIITHRPELLGIGIDEKTGIIVNGNQFEVIGDSYVIVYDGTFWSREGSDLKNLPKNSTMFYFLRAGDKYDDLLKRKVIQ